MRIETERLVLRRFRPGDAEALAESFSDPEVMRWIGDGSTGGIEDARAWIGTVDGPRWRANGLGQLAAERREDRRVLGRIGFLVWSRETCDKGTLAELGEAAEVELG
jgi:RimJ/RimL family protein N-acetyltransferase